MAWTCEQIEGRVSEYLDRLLEPAERTDFEQHLAGCARCAALTRRMEAMIADLHGLEPLREPPGLIPAILDQTLGPRRATQGWRGWLGWLKPVWQPRFAYGAVSVVITVVVLSQALGVQWRKPTLADLNPVNIYRTADRHIHLIYARSAKFVSDLRVVYEIQSRLRPDTEQEAQPAERPGHPPGQTEGPLPKSRRELNRANDKFMKYAVLATTLAAMPGRSLR